MPASTGDGLGKFTGRFSHCRATSSELTLT
jgi:hypothetical protein